MQGRSLATGRYIGTFFLFLFLKLKQLKFLSLRCSTCLFLQLRVESRDFLKLRKKELIVKLSKFTK
jgi:hypothetical protein